MPRRPASPPRGPHRAAPSPPWRTARPGPRALAGALAVTAATWLAPAAAAAAAREWTRTAPGATLTAQVRTARDGATTVRVLRAGRVVLRADAGRLPGRVTARRTTVEHRFGTPAGKRREHRLHARRLRLDADGRRRLELLVARDGVALRLRGFGASTEPTTWRVPRGTRAWLQPYTSAYERPYAETRPIGRGEFGLPALLRTGSGTTALLTESGDRPGDGLAHLRRTRRGLRVVPPSRTRSPDPTPWRVAVLGSLATVVESDLPLALGRPSRIADTGWIRPGRSAWSWWSDSFSTFRPDRLAQFAQLAQREGWEYQTIDARWRRDQLPQVVADATARGVRSLLWFDAADLDTAAKRRRVLDDVAALGIAGIKVDYFLSDRPARTRLYGEIAAAAARRKLVVTLHGGATPRGLQRTWPNVLTVEAVRGAEHARGDEPGPAARDAVDAALIRNPVGSMDYTPVAFSARHRTTTDGHELAKAVAFESGVQTYADTPEAYAARPVAAAVLRAVPAAWDDTRLVAGLPGHYAAIARRDGATWWIGALKAGPARTPPLPLRFLPPGPHVATIVGDDLTETTVPVTRDSVLRVPLGPDGGATIRIDAG